MKKVLVLGGGQMGSVVATDLVDDGYDVVVADIQEVHIPGVRYERFDCESIQSLEAILVDEPDFDLVVGCVPSRYGLRCMEFVVGGFGKNYVDLSFFSEDLKRSDVLYSLNSAPLLNNCTVLYDCGLAPGLPNLILGAVKQLEGGSEIANVYVGGVSKEQTMPYGYVNTWSLDDLLEEYTRPARYLEGGVEKVVDPLESVEEMEMWGGTVEVFTSDGLRSLLSMKEEFPNLVEKTIRWPGHMAEMKKLIESGSMIQELKKKCSTGDDMVLLLVETDHMEFFTMVVAEGGLSAMARTTAHACSAFAKLLLEEEWTEAGTFAPEELGESACSFVLSKLKEHGIFIGMRPSDAAKERNSTKLD